MPKSAEIYNRTAQKPDARAADVKPNPIGLVPDANWKQGPKASLTSPDSAKRQQTTGSQRNSRLPASALLAGLHFPRPDGSRGRCPVRIRSELVRP